MLKVFEGFPLKSNKVRSENAKTVTKVIFTCKLYINNEIIQGSKIYEEW